jgi:hypothetical protein
MRLSLESEGQVGQKNLLKRSIFFFYFASYMDMDLGNFMCGH